MEEKTYKWRWSEYSSTKEPALKEVLRETESTIWYSDFDHNGNPIETKERKCVDYHKWFDTWQSWHIWRIDQIKLHINRLSNNLETARADMERVTTMVEPKEDDHA